MVLVDLVIFILFSLFLQHSLSLFLTILHGLISFGHFLTDFSMVFLNPFSSIFAVKLMLFDLLMQQIRCIQFR